MSWHHIPKDDAWKQATLQLRLSASAETPSTDPGSQFAKPQPWFSPNCGLVPSGKQAPGASK
jgi:hypothetical protein